MPEITRSERKTQNRVISLFSEPRQIAKLNRHLIEEY